MKLYTTVMTPYGVGRIYGRQCDADLVTIGWLVGHKRADYTGPCCDGPCIYLMWQVDQVEVIP
jgi:hypothetical protein